MGQKNKISWTDRTWNPIVGCSKISDGCTHCWAEGQAILHYNQDFPKGWDGRVLTFPERLIQPSHWKKQRKIAVGLMGDLFHDSVPFNFIHEVWDVMKGCPQHIFQILTKRPERMRECVERIYSLQRMGWSMGFWKHVWLGFSAENQEQFDLRWKYASPTWAQVHFVSIEPCLGKIVLPDDFLSLGQRAMVIVGGESGHGARPMHPDWARGLRDQCVAAGVPFHFKQWGEWSHGSQFANGFPRKVKRFQWIDITGKEDSFGDEAKYMARVGKKYTGYLLDGREWLEFSSAA